MNQHYVPRSYLKNFAFLKGKEYYVDAYDKKEERFFQTNIKKICSEIDIYTLQKENLITTDLLVIEKIYSNGIEPLYIKAYELLTNNRVTHITNLQRVEILIGIFQLYIRNPTITKRAIAFHTKEIEKLWQDSQNKGHKGITYLEEDFSFRDTTKEEAINFFSKKVINEFKEKHVNGIGEISDFHEHAIIEISIIQDDTEFITSDNPLVLEDYIVDNDSPLLKSKEFILVLNKKVALRLYHDNTKEIDRVYRVIIPNGSVELINQTILNQSSRFIIANKKKIDIHFKFANNFLNSNSVELKIDSIRQILSKFPVTKDTKPATEVMSQYLKMYETNGTLTDEEVHEMCKKLKQIQAEFLNRRIY